MLGIILGTLCLIGLIATIRRERYFRRHGYPQRGHGHHGCGYGCGGYGHDPQQKAPGAAPLQTPSPETKAPEGATP